MSEAGPKLQSPWLQRLHGGREGWAGVQWLGYDCFSLLFYLGILPLDPLSLLPWHPNPAQPSPTQGIVDSFSLWTVFFETTSLLISPDATEREAEHFWNTLLKKIRKTRWETNQKFIDKSTPSPSPQWGWSTSQPGRHSTSATWPPAQRSIPPLGLPWELWRGWAMLLAGMIPQA